MSLDHRQPADIARTLGERSKARSRAKMHEGSGGTWRRETFTLPRPQARDKAREWFQKYPKAAYMTEIEFWRELSDDCIEFTIRRLPTAD
jgi:hypothetical protein